MIKIWVVNDGYRYNETIRDEHAGREVLQHLATAWSHSSPQQWAERIAAGRVLLDGEPASTTTELRAGQVLVWARPPWQEPDVPLSFEVLFEDADVLVVDKPVGLPTIPGGGEFLQHTLLHQVRVRHGHASPVHRLDRGTSGVVVFARNEQSASALGRQWHSDATKLYRARVAGRPAWKVLEIELPIGDVPHDLMGRVAAVNPAGRVSRTHVRRGPDHDPGLVEATLRTGRPHQIRIHLAAVGYPLVGEPFYEAGGQPAAGSRLVSDTGFHLHAWCVSFDHPTSKTKLSVSAPCPDWARA